MIRPSGYPARGTCFHGSGANHGWGANGVRDQLQPSPRMRSQLALVWLENKMRLFEYSYFFPAKAFVLFSPSLVWGAVSMAGRPPPSEMTPPEGRQPESRMR